MEKIGVYTEKMFENIKHVDENGNEFWYSRKLMPLLEYSKWERFSNVIANARMVCDISGYNIDEHFPEVGKLSRRNNGAVVRIKDYKYQDMLVI